MPHRYIVSLAPVAIFPTLTDRFARFLVHYFSSPAVILDAAPPQASRGNAFMKRFSFDKGQCEANTDQLNFGTLIEQILRCENDLN